MIIHLIATSFLCLVRVDKKSLAYSSFPLREVIETQKNQKRNPELEQGV